MLNGYIIYLKIFFLNKMYLFIYFEDCGLTFPEFIPTFIHFVLVCTVWNRQFKIREKKKKSRFGFEMKACSFLKLAFSIRPTDAKVEIMLQQGYFWGAIFNDVLPLCRDVIELEPRTAATNTSSKNSLWARAAAAGGFPLFGVSDTVKSSEWEPCQLPPHLSMSHLLHQLQSHW